MKKYSKENLEPIIKNNDNIKDCLIQLGRKTTGDNYKFLKRHIQKYDLDISHFTSKKELQKRARIKRGGSFRDEIPVEEIFKKSDIHRGGNDLKRKIFKYSLIKDYRCSLCGQDENWVTGKLSLVLDHINGDNTDNRLENLRFVCPNCDSTLPTFKGRNIKNKNNKKEEKQKLKQNKLKEIEQSLISSKIDFSKKTWGVEVSKILNKSPQYCLKFVKTNFKDLLKTK